METEEKKLTSSEIDQMLEEAAAYHVESKEPSNKNKKNKKKKKKRKQIRFDIIIAIVLAVVVVVGAVFAISIRYRYIYSCVVTDLRIDSRKRQSFPQGGRIFAFYVLYQRLRYVGVYHRIDYRPKTEPAPCPDLRFLSLCSRIIRHPFRVYLSGTVGSDLRRILII